LRVERVNQKEGSTWEEKDENLRSVIGSGDDVDAFGGICGGYTPYILSPGKLTGNTKKLP
jgi:hypothetical protein